ncbi:MAG TPA: ABC transporter permease [Phycisphaerae bacterium]|nr:ABC transporter permease [Phycisphaerae bacterium]
MALKRRLFTGKSVDGSRQIGASKALADDVLEIGRFRHALRFLVANSLKTRYQRSVLGFAWTMLNPLLNLLVMTLVFGILRGKDLKTYMVFLFSGLLPWQFFSATVSQGARSLLSKQSIIRKIFVPKLLFPLSVGLVNLVNILMAMAAMLCLLMLIGADISWHAILFVPAMAIFFIFALGVAIFLMVLTVFFRDLEHIIQVTLRLLFYMSPILWGPREFADKPFFVWINRLNPLACQLELFRHAFYYHQCPPAWLWAKASAMALGMLMCGYLLFKRYERSLVFRL